AAPHPVLRREGPADVVDGAVEQQEMRWLARDAGQRLIEGEEVSRIVARRRRQEQDLRPRSPGEVEEVARKGRKEELLPAAGDDASWHRRPLCQSAALVDRDRAVA